MHSGRPALHEELTVDAVHPLAASQPRVVTRYVAPLQVVETPGAQPVEVARHTPPPHDSVT